MAQKKMGGRSIGASGGSGKKNANPTIVETRQKP